MIKALRIFLFVILLFTGNLMLIVIRMFCPSINNLLTSGFFLLLTVSELLYIIPALPLYMLITRQKFADIAPIKPLSRENTGYILLMSVLIEPAAAFLSAVTTIFYPNAAFEITSGITADNFQAAFIGIAIVPAIAEEICFRGAVLHASRGMSIKSAAIVNGILFGLFHMNLQQIPYAIFLGVILSLFVIYTRSVLSSMLAPFLLNASNLVLSLAPINVPISFGMLFVIAFVFFIGFLSVFKQFRMYNLEV